MCPMSLRPGCWCYLTSTLRTSITPTTTNTGKLLLQFAPRCMGRGFNPEALAGRQVSGMTGRAGSVAVAAGRGCGIPSTSPRATTRRPGGRAARHEERCVEGCPQAVAWSGYARSTGCRTSRRRGRETDRLGSAAGWSAGRPWVRATSSTSQRGGYHAPAGGQAWHNQVQNGDELPSGRSVIGLRQVDEMALGPPFGRSESGARRPVVVGTARHAMA